MEYRNLNDYEILYMVRDEDDNNFMLLVNKYKPLIYKTIKEYLRVFKRFGYEKEDLMQIGYLVLYKASKLYNSMDKTMFYTYLKSSIKKSLITEIRNNITNKRMVLNNALSYDIEIPNTKTKYIDLLIDLNNQKSVDENNLIIFKNSMSFMHSSVFELYYNGYSNQEISLLLDEDIKEIKEIFHRIKTHALTYKYLFFD